MAGLVGPIFAYQARIRENRQGLTMAINSISAQNTYSDSLAKLQQGYSKIFDALKAGDLAAAKAAYTASGLPPMAPSNATALGRLYQALQSKDISAAQSAANELNFKPTSSGAAPAGRPNGKGAPATSASDAQKAALALANAKTAISESSLFSYMDLGSSSDSNMFSFMNVGTKVDLSA